MTVSVLRNLDVGGLTTKAEAIETLVTQVRDRASDIGTGTEPLTGWEGTAADGAREEFRLHRRTFGAIADAVAPGSSALRTAASRLHAAKEKLNGAVAEAADNSDLRVNDDGTVDYVGPQQGGYNPYNPGSYDVNLGQTKAQAERLAGTIHDALLEAERADGEAANDLDRISHDLQSFVPPAGDSTLASAASVPRAGTPPAEVTRWWNSLSTTRQEALLFAHPERLGRLDGIPVLARNRANLTLLASQEGALSAERDAAKRNLDYSRRVDPDGEYTKAASARFSVITGKLRGLDSVMDRLYHPKPGEQPAYLLGVDTAGTGRALVVAGNPDTARNTVTYIPGTSSGLATVGADLGRSDLMIQAADNAAGGPSDTAVVTWVGYEAPQDIPHAALNHYADNAEHNLASFQEGLQATHDGGPSHNVMLGHSYGSTVIGHTARDHPDFAASVNDVVFVGSPGVGVQDVNGLHLSHDQVHATVAAHDMIHTTNADYPVIGDPLGPDPTAARFGADVFASDPGTRGPDATAGLSSQAHSEYWQPRSTSLRNMGKIIIGESVG